MSNSKPVSQRIGEAAEAAKSALGIGKLDLTPDEFRTYMETAIAFHFACAQVIDKLLAGQSGELLFEQRDSSIISISDREIRVKLIMGDRHPDAVLQVTTDQLKGLNTDRKTVEVFYKLLVEMKLI